MQLVKASRQTEIGELDMTTTVKQDIIRFDITDMVSKLYFAELYLKTSCSVKAHYLWEITYR